MLSSAVPLRDALPQRQVAQREVVRRLIRTQLGLPYGFEELESLKQSSYFGAAVALLYRLLVGTLNPKPYTPNPKPKTQKSPKALQLDLQF